MKCACEWETFLVCASLGSARQWVCASSLVEEQEEGGRLRCARAASRVLQASMLEQAGQDLEVNRGRRPMKWGLWALWAMVGGQG